MQSCTPKYILLAALSLIAEFLDNGELKFLVGFIQVSGLKFYKYMPPGKERDQWFTKFRVLTDYKVLT